MNCSNVRPSSRVELRVYEKHFFTVERVGTLEYAIPTIANFAEARFGETSTVFGFELSAVLIVLML